MSATMGAPAPFPPHVESLARTDREPYAAALYRLKGAVQEALDALHGWDGDTPKGERQMEAAQDACGVAAAAYLAALEGR